MRFDLFKTDRIRCLGGCVISRRVCRWRERQHRDGTHGYVVEKENSGESFEKEEIRKGCLHYEPKSFDSSHNEASSYSTITSRGRSSRCMSNTGELNIRGEIAQLCLVNQACWKEDFQKWIWPPEPETRAILHGDIRLRHHTAYA